jgi:hypothetical protein
MSSSDDYSLTDAYARVRFGKTPRQLSEMSESELLVWQENHPPDSPQSSMADREWSRRLVVEQLKVTLESNALAREANDIARSASFAATAAASSASSANTLAWRSNLIATIATVIAAIATIISVFKS